MAHRYHSPNDVIAPDWDLAGMVEDTVLLFRVGRRLRTRTGPRMESGRGVSALRYAAAFADDRVRQHTPAFPIVSTSASILPRCAPVAHQVNEGLAKELGLTRPGTSPLGGGRRQRGPGGRDPIAPRVCGSSVWQLLVLQLGDGRAAGHGRGRGGKRRTLRPPVEGLGAARRPRGGDGPRRAGPVLPRIHRERGHGRARRSGRPHAGRADGRRRRTEEMPPGAVLIRVAASHLRIGTFELFNREVGGDAVQSLVAYALSGIFRRSPSRAAPRHALKQVIDAQAALVARWLGIGFIHGVMNTDNTTISGETIDYGPLRVSRRVRRAAKALQLDLTALGRYAPSPMPKDRADRTWRRNLAERVVLPCSASEEQQVEIGDGGAESLVDVFEARKTEMFRTKLGLFTADDGDRALAEDLPEEHGVGRRRLHELLPPPSRTAAPTSPSMFEQPGAFHDWEARWSARCSKEDAGRAKRGRHAGRESRLHSAESPRGGDRRCRHQLLDFAPFERLVSVLSKLYEEQPEHAALADAPRPEFQQGYRTFWGPESAPLQAGQLASRVARRGQSRTVRPLFDWIRPSPQYGAKVQAWVQMRTVRGVDRLMLPPLSHCSGPFLMPSPQ